MSAITHHFAAIVSIGDELTLGQTLDTNSRWLSQRLMELGIVPVEHVTVPDDCDAHRDALLRLADKVDLILCSGGLGPTADDLTREALAKAMGDSLVEDQLALAQIEAWYASRGRTMSDLNRTQALRPTRAKTIPNHHGTAPGLHATMIARASGGGQTSRGCDVFCLPGPPKEMSPMFEQYVVPRLVTPVGKTVRTRVLHTFGLAESDLAQRLGMMMSREALAANKVLVGTTASGGVVSIRMRYEGPLAPVEAESELDETERQCRDVAGAYIFGRGSDSLASVVLAMLKQAGQTIGTVESCTGGLLGAQLTDVPGSSAAFAGGLVTYTNQLKSLLANVPEANFEVNGPGAVSRETATAMALGGLETLGCDHTLAITGIAGPEGGSAKKPVGLVWIARASKSDEEVDCRAFQFSGDRASIREWAARTALAMAWQHLAGLPAMKLLREV